MEARAWDISYGLSAMVWWVGPREEEIVEWAERGGELAQEAVLCFFLFILF